GKPRREQSRSRVNTSARRKSDDQSHPSARVVLRRRSSAEGNRAQQHDSACREHRVILATDWYEYVQTILVSQRDPEAGTRCLCPFIYRLIGHPTAGGNLDDRSAPEGIGGP